VDGMRNKQCHYFIGLF